MRRKKAYIVTFIYAMDDCEVATLSKVVELADIWSDAIRIAYFTGFKGGDVSGLSTLLDISDKLVHMYANHESRLGAWQSMANSAPVYRKEPVVIVGLEPSWIISDPHIVRAAIELNPMRSLMAKRHFMVDDDHYRADGIYQPYPIPISYPFNGGAHFTSEIDVAPHYAWRNLRAEAPFSILDYAYRGAVTENATLRMFEGMIPV